MKIYLPTPEYRTYFNQHTTLNLTFVDAKSEAEVIISGRFSREDFQPKLKAVIVPYTGLDHIDLALIKAESIPLFNTTEHSKFVAEKALQLLLALLGNVVNFHNALSHGDWSERINKDRKPWVSLFNRKIGIYGYGRIGRIFKDIVAPFTKDITVIDRGKDYPGVTAVKDLETLIAKSEIVVIAAPLTCTTRGSFNQTILNQMQDKYLINVGRGPIIEEEALFYALKNQVLKGFASDVWYQYHSQKQPIIPPSKYPLELFDNVVLSPHCGGYTTEFNALMVAKLLDYVEAIAKGDYSEALMNGGDNENLL